MSDLKRRRDEHAEETRSAIVEAAFELFYRNGYRSTSLDDIAERARVSKGAVYHHFANKGAVFESVLAQVNQKLMASVESCLAAARTDVGFTDLLNAYLDASVDPVYCRLALEQAPIALGWERWRELDQEQVLGQLMTLLKQHHGEAFNVEASPEFVVRSMVGAVHEMTLAIVASAEPNRAHEEARLLLGEMVASLRPHVGR